MAGSASVAGSVLRQCPCTLPSEAATAAWGHPGTGKQGGRDTLSPSAKAATAHLSETRVLAGSEPTILSKQWKTLLSRLRLALLCRQLPAVGCLSPERIVDVRQTLHIVLRGCLHHTAVWGRGPAEVMGCPPGALQRPAGTTHSWTLCRCPRSPLHRAMALVCIRRPALHARLRIADCILIKRLFRKGLFILFAIMQSPVPPVHGCTNSPSGKCISCLCRREILARLNATLSKPNGTRVFQRSLAESR